MPAVTTGNAPKKGLLKQTVVSVRRPWDLVRVGQEPRGEVSFEPVWDEVVRLYATGLHPAVALHITHRGRPVLDRTIGHVRNAPGGAPGAVATPETLFNLFSASKIVTATLVHALVDDGLLALDAPVVRYLPGFSPHGKHTIQLRHLLNHTAGIPDMPRGFDFEAAVESGRMPLEPLFALRPQSAPGVRSAYHPLTSWFLIQEIVERVTGRPLRDVLRSRLLEPLGFERMTYGVPLADVDRVARHAVTGPPVPGVMARIFERSIGLSLEDAVPLTNEANFLTATLPSANVIAAPREVSRFMQLLLNGGALGGVRVLSERAVRRMLTEVTPRQFDATFGFPMRYGLGVMMGGRRFSLFGLNTPGAFGHLGLSTVVVYADPARDLCVSFLNTGKPMMAPGMLRWYWALQQIALRIPRR